MDLIAHPDHAPTAVTAVSARIIGHDAHWLSLRWRVEGTRDLVVPPFAGKGRRDELWRTTCFELFVAVGDAYAEFNFAPSERWAAYDFTAYREDMSERPMPRDPVITPRRGRDVLILDVALPVADLAPLPARYALTAVIEEVGGVRSFWAMQHPAGAPDFHDRACFAGLLAAPPAP